MKTPALLLLTCVVSLFVFPSAAQSQSLFSEDYCKQKVSDASSLESCERRFRWRAYRKQKQRAEGLWRRRYQQPVDRDFALRQQNVTDFPEKAPA